MASYFHIWMLPRHFYVVFDIGSRLLNLSISTDKNSSLQIESFAIVNLSSVSTKLN